MRALIYPPARVVFLLVITLLLCACASSRVDNTTPPPLTVPGSDMQVDDVDVLALTPEMESFLEEYILPYNNSDTRLHLLAMSVARGGVLGFEYDEGKTLTAAEAFATRSGNCIGFSNMMVALARRAGLNAKYQEVHRYREWSSRDDTVLLVKHINVKVKSRNRTYVVDVSGYKLSPEMHREIISDLDAKALYYNNLGAEALLEGNLGRSYAYLATAIEESPSNSDSWVNLGVLYARNDQMDDAELALKTAINIDSGELSAMSNLYEVYIDREDLEAAEEMREKVERYRMKNPYYLMILSEDERALGRYDESIDLLQQAIRKKKNDHLLHYELAKTQYLSGETDAAQDSFLRAKELAPRQKVAYYNRPLDVLITEEQSRIEQ